MSFESLNLDSKLLRAITACGFNEPTEIQVKAIPEVATGRDLMGSAPTGTGKTAAFVLPILQRLLEPSTGKGRGPRALILVPTRELAMQVNDNIKQFNKYTQFKAARVVGGEPYPKQLDALRNPLDILVATPGRLLDHFEKGRVDFNRLEVFVLDEADRMLDMGFIEDITILANAAPKNRQTLLFSATLQGKVLDVARQLLKDPAKVEVTNNPNAKVLITQYLHHADNIGHKLQLLAHYLNENSLYQALIFTATKVGAENLADELNANDHKADALHGDMRQGARKRAVEKMREGKTRLLVATDVAARGLDIKGLTHVINFDLPMVAEDYVHRIGRTGRCGETGVAISFVGPQDRVKLSRIERYIKTKIQSEVIPGLEPKRSNTNSDPKRSANRGGGNSRFASKPGQNQRFKSRSGSSDAPRRPQSDRFNSEAPRRARPGSDSFNNAAPQRPRRGADQFSHAAPQRARRGSDQFSSAAPQRARRDSDQFSSAAPQRARRDSDQFSSAAPHRSRRGPDQFSNAAPQRARRGADQFNSSAPQRARSSGDQFSNYQPQRPRRGSDQFSNAAPYRSRSGAEEYGRGPAQSRERPHQPTTAAAPALSYKRRAGQFKNGAPQTSGRGPSAMQNRTDQLTKPLAARSRITLKDNKVEPQKPAVKRKRKSTSEVSETIV